MKKSKLFKIAKSDVVKAFWMFLISTIVSVIGDSIMQEISNGSYSIDAIHWKEIGLTILATTIAYLKKQFLTNSDGDLFKKEETKLNG